MISHVLEIKYQKKKKKKASKKQLLHTRIHKEQGADIHGGEDNSGEKEMMEIYNQKPVLAVNYVLMML